MLKLAVVLTVLASPILAEALDDAIRARDPAAAAAALDAGAPIDAPVPPLNLTPLAMAAVRDDAAMVALLLDRGADPNAAGLLGITPLSAAVRSCRTAPELIRRLIEAGADLETRSGAGLTPLMAAIQEERTEIAELLLASGADVNTRNLYGDGVLNYAIYTHNPVIVQAAMDRQVETAQLNLLFTTAIYYYPGFGQARPHGRPGCAVVE